MTNLYQRLYETASYTELAWTLIGLLCVPIAIWGLVDAWMDKNALVKAKLNGGRRIVANGSIRREVFRSLSLLTIIGVGIVADASPPANPSTPITAVGIILTIGLIILELVIAISTVTDRLERAKLISYINEYELDRVSITNLAELQRALDVALKSEDDRVKRVYNERQSSR